MITGYVRPTREAVVRLLVFGINGAIHEIEPIVDTGFTEDLTLPIELIDALQLPRETTDRVRLSDGTEI